MKKMLEMEGILSHEIDSVWEKVSPMLNKALRYSFGKYTTESIREFLKGEQMQLWVGIDYYEIRAFTITQIVNYPGKKILIIMFAGGSDLSGWLSYIEILKRFAKKKGCDGIEIYGRNGWVKKLKPFGYVHIHNVYRQELSGAHRHAKDMDQKRI